VGVERSDWLAFPDIIFLLVGYLYNVSHLQLKELKERQRQQNKQKAIKLGLDPE
jgi:hypothetical protein